MSSVLRTGNPFKRQSVESIIIRALTAEGSTHINGGRLHASKAGICPRRNVLHASEDQTHRVDAASQLYTDIGSSVHKLFQQALFDAGRLLFAEYHLPEVGYNLGGYVDAIVLGERTKIEIWEFKTCGKLPPAPYPEHRAQAMLYAAIAGLPAHIVYQSRNVASFDRALLLRSFKVEATEEEYLVLLRKVALSAFAIEAEQVPPVPPEFSGPKDCRFCPFVPYCWTGERTPTWPEMTATTLREMNERATSSARDVWSRRGQRRNGTLKFLSQNGSPHAKKLLDGTDWSELIEEL